MKSLILNGGGVHGIAYLGAIKRLEELNIIQSIESFTGVSVGSILSLLIVVGYKVNDLEKFFKQIKNEDACFLDILDTYGVYKTNSIINLVVKLLNNKNISRNITFCQLYTLAKKELIIVATNLTKKRTEYFCYKTTPDTRVINAIRLSINIPVFFEAVKYKGDFYIDGGFSDNFPVEPLKLDGTRIHNIPLEQTMIIRTVRNDNNIENFESYIMNVFECIMKFQINHKLKVDSKNLCEIVINDIKSVDFDLSYEQITFLFSCGYNTMNSLNLKECSSKSESNINNIESSDINSHEISETFIE